MGHSSFRGRPEATRIDPLWNNRTDVLEIQSAPFTFLLSTSLWRFVTALYVKSAFSGESARLYGGRWNRKGVPLVYTAGSQSLAVLEMLVQDEPLRARYTMIEARIPAGITIDRRVYTAAYRSIC